MIRFSAIAILVLTVFAAGNAQANPKLQTAMQAEKHAQSVQVTLAGGGSVAGTVNPRTSSLRLWLEVKSGANLVVLPLRWSQLTAVKTVAPVVPVVPANRMQTQAERAHGLLFNSK